MIHVKIFGNGKYKVVNDPFKISQTRINRPEGGRVTMSNVDWITSEQLETAKKKALKIFNEFCEHSDCEQEWTEIEIDGKYFDVECYDETGADTGNYRKGTMYCAIYPTYVNQNGWRETDGTEWIRLFIKANGNLFTKTEANDDNTRAN